MLHDPYVKLIESEEVKRAIGRNVPYDLFLEAYVKIAGTLRNLLEEERRYGNRIGSTEQTRIIDKPLFDNESLLEMLAKDPDERVRALVATKTNFPEGCKDILLLLAQDSSQIVQLAVATRETFPDELNLDLISSALLKGTPATQLAVHNSLRLYAPPSIVQRGLEP